MIENTQAQHIKVSSSIHASLEQLEAVDVAFDRSIVPFEDQPGLDRFLILTDLLDKSAHAWQAAVESDLQPELQFFSSAMPQHLSKLLK